MTKTSCNRVIYLLRACSTYVSMCACVCEGLRVCVCVCYLFGHTHSIHEMARARALLVQQLQTLPRHKLQVL